MEENSYDHDFLSRVETLFPLVPLYNLSSGPEQKDSEGSGPVILWGCVGLSGYSGCIGVRKSFPVRSVTQGETTDPVDSVIWKKISFRGSSLHTGKIRLCRNGVPKVELFFTKPRGSQEPTPMRRTLTKTRNDDDSRRTFYAIYIPESLRKELPPFFFLNTFYLSTRVYY